MKIAILGLGRVFKHYEKNFIPSLLSDGHNLFLYDKCKQQYPNSIFSEEYNFVYSLDDLVNNDIDFAIISTISGSHYELAKILLTNGINVLTEKPPTMNVIELLELINIADKNKLKYGVIFQNRFNSSMQITQELINNKHLGEIKICSIRLHWCRYQDYYNDGWHGTWKLDGGVINQQAIHHIDAMQWINGPFELVSASSSNQINSLEAEDTMISLVNFVNGSIGTIEASTAIRPMDNEASIFISGTKGFIKVGGIALNKIENFFISDLDENISNRLNKSSEDVDSGYGNSHKKIIYDFINSINLDIEPCIPASSTINTIQAIHGIYRSCESGNWTKVGKSTVSSLLGK